MTEGQRLRPRDLSWSQIPQPGRNQCQIHLTHSPLPRKLLFPKGKWNGKAGWPPKPVWQTPASSAPTTPKWGYFRSHFCRQIYFLISIYSSYMSFKNNGFHYFQTHITSILIRPYFMPSFVPLPLLPFPFPSSSSTFMFLCTSHTHYLWILESTWKRRYNVYLSESGLFCLAWYSPVPSTFWQTK